MLTRLLGFLPSPWLLLGAGLALAGAFAYGLKIGNERLESFKIAVEAVGKVAEERRKDIIEKQKALKKETEDEIQKALATLATDYGTALRLLNTRPSVRIVSTPKPSPAGVPDASGAKVADTRYCADAEELDRRANEALRQARAEALGLLREVEEAATVGRICAAWAVKQETRTP